MAEAARAETRYTVEQYFGLVDQGVLRPDDRIELLEGVIVAMSPQNPAHASATTRVYRALESVVGQRAVIRVQLPFVASAHSAPEPDVTLVAGTESDYDTAHPTTALLVAEVADTSLLQDRLTKAAIYAAAGVPEYWLVNLPDDCVEVFRAPDPATGRYAERRIAKRGDRLNVVAFADASIAVDDVLPARS